MTDASGDAYVKQMFASYPELVKIYLSLTIPILKADILRYLILFAEGGVWLDLDVSCEGISIDDWVPEKFKAEASLVVGWEFDVGWGYYYKSQLASWAIMARPKVAHLWAVVEDIVQAIADKSNEYNVTAAGLTIAMVGDVVDFTGPWRLTQSVLKSLETTLGQSLNYTDITNLRQPKLVGDVLILPGYSFSAVTNDIEPEDGSATRLVIHHYAGSWKNDYGGEGAE